MGEILKFGAEVEAVHIGDHKFEFSNVASERLIRFLASSGHSIKGGEGPSSEFEGITPRQIARNHYGLSDGYYEFDRVSGELIIDGAKPVRFEQEVKKSHTTFFRGILVKLNQPQLMRGWASTARELARKGYDNALIVPFSKDRPFADTMYPLNPGDEVLYPLKPTQSSTERVLTA